MINGYEGMINFVIRGWHLAASLLLLALLPNYALAAVLFIYSHGSLEPDLVAEYSRQLQDEGITAYWEGVGSVDVRLSSAMNEDTWDSDIEGVVAIGAINIAKKQCVLPSQKIVNYHHKPWVSLIPSSDPVFLRNYFMKSLAQRRAKNKLPLVQKPALGDYDLLRTFQSSSFSGLLLTNLKIQQTRLSGGTYGTLFKSGINHYLEEVEEKNFLKYKNQIAFDQSNRPDLWVKLAFGATLLTALQALPGFFDVGNSFFYEINDNNKWTPSELKAALLSPIIPALLYHLDIAKKVHYWYYKGFYNTDPQPCYPILLGDGSLQAPLKSLPTIGLPEYRHAITQ